MCFVRYTFYDCGHTELIWREDIEFCANRICPAYGPNWRYDFVECPYAVSECEGINDYDCDECCEFMILEGDRTEL